MAITLARQPMPCVRSSGDLGTAKISLWHTSPSWLSAHIAAVNQGLSVERAQELVDEATFATREKSIKNLINIRTEAAIRGRSGGPPHDAGELAAKAVKEYDSDPSKWRRGKIVLNELRSMLHQELKKSPVIFQRSAHLQYPELRKISEAIWPPKKG